MRRSLNSSSSSSSSSSEEDSYVPLSSYQQVVSTGQLAPTPTDEDSEVEVEDNNTPMTTTSAAARQQHESNTRNPFASSSSSSLTAAAAAGGGGSQVTLRRNGSSAMTETHQVASPEPSPTRRGMSATASDDGSALTATLRERILFEESLNALKADFDSRLDREVRDMQQQTVALQNAHEEELGELERAYIYAVAMGSISLRRAEMLEERRMRAEYFQRWQDGVIWKLVGRMMREGNTTLTTTTTTTTTTTSSEVTATASSVRLWRLLQDSNHSNPTAAAAVTRPISVTDTRRAPQQASQRVVAQQQPEPNVGGAALSSSLVRGGGPLSGPPSQAGSPNARQPQTPRRWEDAEVALLGGSVRHNRSRSILENSLRRQGANDTPNTPGRSQRSPRLHQSTMSRTRSSEGDLGLLTRSGPLPSAKPLFVSNNNNVNGSRRTVDVGVQVSSGDGTQRAFSPLSSRSELLGAKGNAARKGGEEDAKRGVSSYGSGRRRARVIGRWPVTMEVAFAVSMGGVPGSAVL